jgi:type IV secretory pathway TraG/TraD family ATPase VirD4
MNLLKVILWPFWVILLVLAKLSDALVRGSWSLAFGRKPESLNIHGDAKWADRKTLKRAGVFTPGGLLYGLYVENGWIKPRLRRMFTHPESSFIGIAPKGMGKTQSTIAMMREQVSREYPADFLCLDPAGDISAAVVPLMKERGYDVKVVDFRNPADSDKLDILSDIDPNEPDFDKQLIGRCEGIIEDDTGGRDEHWTESSRGLVFAMLFGFMTEDRQSASMFKMAQALTDAKERFEVFKRFAKLVNPSLRAGLNAFMEAGDKERGSFTTTVTRKVRVWLLEGVRRITSDIMASQRWSFEDLWRGNKPSAVFIIVGLRSDRNSEGAIARAAITCAVQVRQKIWDEEQGRNKDFKFKRNIVCVVDEGLMIGNCKALVDANVQLRKAGWRQWLMYPSLEDLRELFGRAAAASLMGGCVRWVLGGSGELGTYKEMAELLGRTTINNPNYNESERGSSTGGSAASRNLANAEEIRGLEFGEFMGVARNLNVRGRIPVEITKDGVKYL